MGWAEHTARTRNEAFIALKYLWKITTLNDQVDHLDIEGSWLYI
jgi:hypothetical protein